MGDRPHPVRLGCFCPGAPALSGPLCSETPLGGWGLHSGIQGVTGQRADSASNFTMRVASKIG